MVERVLIVDDDPVQCHLVENNVAKAGYESTSVDGGEAALKAMLATTSPYDCVVLDLVMPDLDGLGVLGRMREAGLEIPVIVQIAHGGIDNVATAMRAGAVDFVVKPVGFERLSVSLRNAMAAQTLAREIALLKRGRSGTLKFAGGRRSPAQTHATLVPPDDVDAQLCESTMGRASTEALLFLRDSASPEHTLIPVASTGGGSALNLLNDGGNIRSLEDIEADVIRFALAHYRGQISEVARRLRIGRSTLYRKLETLGCTMANDTGS